MDVFVRNNIVLLLLLVQIMTFISVNGHRRKPSFCDEAQISSSFLWTLPNREPPVYFFGTIHVPYTRVWDYVPWSAKRAFERADSVFFELDLTDPETVAQLASCQMLPSGETLSDVLPGDIYRRLKRHLDYVKLMMPSWMKDEHRGLYAEYLFKAIAGNWEKKRPVWVMLMVNSLTESDVRSRGIPVLDLFLAREAARLGKRAGAVERVEEQCLPLNGLNVSQVLFALNQSLLLQESLRHGRSSPSYGTEDLVRHYNCGDLGSVGFGQDPSSASSENGSSADELLLSRNMDKYFRKELIEKRNARMADRVLQLIRKYPDESFFFAFGAGHFLGNSSVLEYVEEGGFKVEQVAPDAKIRRFINRKPGNSFTFPKKEDNSGVKVPDMTKLPQPTNRQGTARTSVNVYGRLAKYQRYHEVGDKLGDCWRCYRRPHHHPRPRGPAEDGFTNDLSGTRGSWEDGSRRRYRKRGHHHHGVQLLRTVSTPPPTRGKQQRQFNDLWIKLDSKDRSSSRNTQASDDPFQRNSRKNSKLWYGGSSSGGEVLAIQLTIFHTFILTLSVAIFSQRQFIVL